MPFRRLILSLVSAAVALVLAMAAVEAWVRVQWDDLRGRPGFYLSDPELGQRLAPGYDGWFAGVPVRINDLGFRDTRDYEVKKAPGTFRALVLGDSVTFGHGTRNETTYPFLLEERLRAWRPEVNWEVWNLGVPGYATSQELALLHRVADRYQPDLVIVGFFQNDLAGNEPLAPPSLTRRVRSAAQRTMQRYFYSYELYKRAYLTARWRLLADENGRDRLEHLVTEEALLGRQDFAFEHAAQDLTPYETLPENALAGVECPSMGRDLRRADELRARLAGPDAAMQAWLDAVDGFQRVAATADYPVVFFINMAPEQCPETDRFFDGGALAFNDLLEDVLGEGVPVVSTVRAFLRHRPSEMPGAAGHSVGNANVVKADVLFSFLKESVLDASIVQGATTEYRVPSTEYPPDVWHLR